MIYVSSAKVYQDDTVIPAHLRRYGASWAWLWPADGKFETLASFGRVLGLRPSSIPTAFHTHGRAVFFFFWLTSNQRLAALQAGAVACEVADWAKGGGTA